MNHTFLALAGICAFAFAEVVPACEPAPPDLRRADVIFLGYVTGERWPDLEAQYSGGVDADIVGNARGYPLLLLRVVQTEHLKGTAPHIIEAVSHCAVRLEAGEKVVVSKRNSEYSVYATHMIGGDQAVRDAVLAPR